MSDHRALYKNSGLDAKELRRRREEDSLQLRKQKRDDVLSKKRTIKVEDDIPLDISEDFSINKDVINALTQDTNQVLLIESAQKIRKILSKDPQPPFDEVIQSGLIPRFVQLLDRADDPVIQFEIAWILTNICSGTSEQTRVVVDHGAIPKLVSLLKSPDLKVCEQAVWALGNIIGDNAEFRDLVIQQGFVVILIDLILNPRFEFELGFLRNETWVLVNLCRNKNPPPNIDIIEQIIPALYLLTKSTDLAILIDTTWAISYISELGSEYSRLVIHSGLVERITPLLSHEEIKIQTAVIRALGSIVTGNDEQTQAVIDAGALPHLNRILSERKDKIVKEALWFISNITAGSVDQIQAIIDNRLIGPIIDHLRDGDYSQQKEAAWTIYNLCLSGHQWQIETLIQANVIPPLCNMLSIKDVGVCRNVLEAILTILNTLHSSNPKICEQIEDCGGLDKIESLMDNPNYDIDNLASHIMSEYFNSPE